jgi:hypothetical protein
MVSWRGRIVSSVESGRNTGSKNPTNSMSGKDVVATGLEPLEHGSLGDQLVHWPDNAAIDPVFGDRHRTSSADSMPRDFLTFLW